MLPERGMAFFGPLLLLLGKLSLSVFFLLLVWALYFYAANVKMPRGICQPRTLRIFFIFLIMFFSLDNLLSKMGFCKEYGFVNFLSGFMFLNLNRKTSSKNLNIQGVPVRLYQNKSSQRLRKGIVYIHGGAGSLATLDMFDNLCHHIAHEADAVVLSIGYSLVPHKLYPTQFQECLDVTVHVLKHAEDYGVDPTRIIMSGDSFGALLVATTCQSVAQRKGLPQIRAQMLIYPVLQFVTLALPSHLQNRSTPPLPLKITAHFALQYLQKCMPLSDILIEGSHISKDVKMKYQKWVSADNIPEEFKVGGPKAVGAVPLFGELDEVVDELCKTKLSPLLAEDEILQQLPETFILTCQFDILRDDGVLYKKRLEDNGVSVSWHHFEEGFHGALSLFGCWFFDFSCSRAMVASVAEYIRAL